MGLTVAVVALALIDRGMDLFQISLLFGVYSATTMAMELPFGGLADNIGRKPVFLSAVVASLISLGLFLSTSDFHVLALSFVFIGFGRALRSGTLEAWFVENFRAMAPDVDIQPALAKAQFANAVGLAFGAICGGLLPDAFGDIAAQRGFSVYDVSYAASLIMMVVLFLYTTIAITENPSPLNRKALGQGIRNVPAVIRDAGFLALKHPTLSMLLLALALFLMATNPVEVFWPTHGQKYAGRGLRECCNWCADGDLFLFNCVWCGAIPSHQSNVQAPKRCLAFGGFCLPCGSSNRHGISERNHWLRRDFHAVLYGSWRGGIASE